MDLWTRLSAWKVFPRSRARAALSEDDRVEIGQRFDSFTRHDEIALVIDEKGRIVRATPRAAEAYRYTLPELEGANIADLRELASAGEISGQMEEVRRHGLLRFEARHRRRDGSTFLAEVRSVLLKVNGRPYWWSLIQDITERRKTEERLRVAFEASPDPMTLARLEDGQLVAVNEGFLKLHGFSEGEVLGRRTSELGIWCDPADRTALAERVRAEGSVRNREVRVRAADGSVRVLSFSAKQVTVEGVAHMLSLARDVTEERAAALERERLSAKLRQSEERYRSVVRSVPVVQWAIDAGGLFTLSEGRGLEVLGLIPGEVVGRSVFEVYRDHPEVLADYRRALSGESFVTINRFGPTAFESYWGPIRDDAGVHGVTGIALDITARRRAEDQFLQAQKMEAVGRLASGVAHDFSNLLVVILGGCENLAEIGKREPAVLPDVTAIEDAGRKAANLVRQLLAFARGGESHPVISDLNALVTGMEKLLRRTIGEDIAVVVKPGQELWPTRVDPTQFDQLLMNLAVNARDAMPGGGSLTIETRNAEPREAGLPGRFTCLAVSDTGCGMTPGVQARVFEPFFTTKELGKGTGLGLAAVFGIVQQHGGHIALASQPGQGTTFRIYFPAPAEESASGPAPSGHAPELAGKGLTVLLVEDDDAVRRSTTRMLRDGGFEVKEAASGTEALAQGREGGIDLVLTDVVMPGMPGTELATRLHALEPGLPIVFLSGYVDSKSYPIPEGALLLGKPFTRSALYDLIARGLRGEGQPAPPPARPGLAT